MFETTNQDMFFPGFLWDLTELNSISIFLFKKNDGVMGFYGISSGICMGLNGDLMGFNLEMRGKKWWFPKMAPQIIQVRPF